MITDHTGEAAPVLADADIRQEIMALAKLYQLEEKALSAKIDQFNFDHYAEYVLTEDNLEIITGGVGQEDYLTGLAKKMQVSDTIITAFKKCIATFPAKMQYLKLCFGPTHEQPTLYLELMEAWEAAFSFLETLPELHDAIPRLKQITAQSKLCVLLAFSQDKASGQLLVKTYQLAERANKPAHAPLMLSYRLCNGSVSEQAKFYKSVTQENRIALSDRLRHITGQSAVILTRQYWSLYGYQYTNNAHHHLKIYVFRKDRRFNTWGPRNDSIYTSEGNIMLRLRRLEDAVSSYTNAIDYYAKDFNAYVNRALCYALLGQHRLAIEDAGVARALEPNMNFSQSGAYFNFIREVSGIAEQLATAPSAALYNQMGVLLFSKGLYPEAKQQFEMALTLDKDFAQAHNNLGGACINLGLFAQAFDHCGIAISLDDNSDISNYTQALHGMRDMSRRESTLSQGH